MDGSKAATVDERAKDRNLTILCFSRFFENETPVVKLVFKTVVLLLPLACCIMETPLGDKVFLLGGIIGLAELSRIRGAVWELRRTLPIVTLVTLYIAIRFLAPTVDEIQETYDRNHAIYSVFYALPAGFCLRYWNRGNENNTVFIGYVLFCLVLVAAGWFMINAPGAEQVITLTNDGLSRANPDTGIQYLRFFKVGNVIIGVIPYSIFAMSAIPALITPCKTWLKLLLGATALGAFFLSLAVVTRTAIIATLFSVGCLLPLQLSSQRAKEKLRAILVAAGAVLITCVVALTLDREKFQFLLKRIFEANDDGRLYVWKEAVPLIMRFPMGGGVAHLNEAPWAHNLFLDMALLGGLPALIVMITLYGFIFYAALRAARNKRAILDPLSIALLGGLIAAFAVSMLHPPQVPLIVFTYLVGAYSLAPPLTRGAQIDISQTARKAVAHVW